MSAVASLRRVTGRLKCSMHGFSGSSKSGETLPRAIVTPVVTYASRVRIRHLGERRTWVSSNFLRANSPCPLTNIL